MEIIHDRKFESVLREEKRARKLGIERERRNRGNR